MRRLPKARETARSFGLEPVCEFDPNVFDSEVLPVVPYAELFAGGWAEDDVRARLGSADPALLEQLAALRAAHGEAISAWLKVNAREPDRPYDELPPSQWQRLYESYPEWKGQNAYWNEFQSPEFNAMCRLRDACDIAYFEVNPPRWTRR